jgi:hypothetical protein
MKRFLLPRAIHELVVERLNTYRVKNLMYKPFVHFRVKLRRLVALPHLNIPQESIKPKVRPEKYDSENQPTQPQYPTSDRHRDAKPMHVLAPVQPPRGHRIDPKTIVHPLFDNFTRPVILTLFRYPTPPQPLLPL